MGQRNGFSQSDITKINNMYLCRPAGSPAGSPAGGSVTPVRPAGGSGFLGLVGSLFGLKHEENETAIESATAA
jgi:hypothetical protein